MDFDTVDVLYKSRKTLLKILKSKGYDTTPYEKFGPFEIETMSSGDKEASLKMLLTRKVPDDSKLTTICRVEYAIPRVKNRLSGFVSKIVLDDDDSTKEIDTKTTEVIVMTLESISDTFHAEARQQWGKRKLRISFFDAHTLIIDPRDHVLVPKHEVVPEDKHEALFKEQRVENGSKFPIIRFHEDIIGRILGLTPGSVVRITRPSPSAGTYTQYRCCI